MVCKKELEQLQTTSLLLLDFLYTAAAFLGLSPFSEIIHNDKHFSI